jgi:hypothetical protein
MSYKDGEFCSYGIQPPDDEGWESGYIKEFKRQIHRLQTNSVSQLKRELLPAGVSLEAVYQHWIQYIFNHAKKEYEQHHQIPPDAWLERELIFTIPNGWATPEETLIRAAILGAKCVENEENIHFVSESDAVLHFMLVQSPSELKDSRELIVCDAGASTIDIALYRIIKVDPLEISETKNTPSISIEADLSSVLEEPLISTSGLMVGDSKDVEEPGHDSTRDSPLDAEIEKIIKRIDQLKKGHDPKLLVLAGGFCRDPRVHNKLSDRYDPGLDEPDVPDRMKVLRPEAENFNAAAADGALLWSRSNKVASHATSYAYGCAGWVLYSENLPDLAGRKVIQFNKGKYVDNSWRPIVQFGEVVKKGTTRRMPFSKTYDIKYADLSKVEVNLYAAEKTANQHWVLTPNGKLMAGFHLVSKIQADLSVLRGKLPSLKPRDGYKLDFEVEILFGTHSLEATIIWKDGRYTARFSPPENASEGWKQVQ